MGRLLVGLGLDEGVQRKGKREVTIMSLESWRAAEQEPGVTLDPAVRRANLLVSGVELLERKGSVLVLGGCRILVQGETTPCHRMDEAHPGLRRALETGWRGGVYGQVLAGGRIEVGDAVSWEDASERTGETTSAE